MRTRTITLNIPRWVPTRHQWGKWKKQVKLFVFPPRCNSCNCKLQAEFPVYFKYRAGHHMGYDNTYAMFAVDPHDKKCASCLKQYIHDLSLPIGTCEMCLQTNTKVIEYHYDIKGKTITFLWHWWNGKKFCLTCVDDLLDTGNVKNEF